MMVILHYVTESHSGDVSVCSHGNVTQSYMVMECYNNSDGKFCTQNSYPSHCSCVVIYMPGCSKISVSKNIF